VSGPSKRLGEFDPFDPEVVEDPREFFAALRREAPLYRLPNGAYFLISRYEDVRNAALRPEIFSSNLVAVLMESGAGGGRPEIFELPTSGARAVDVLAIADAPQHTRQRKLSNKAFSMRRVAAMEPRLRALADGLFRGPLSDGRADWVEQMAVPLPLTVIAELIGLPLEDTPRLKRGSDASVALLSGVNTKQQLAAHATEVSALIRYLAERFDEAHEVPGDNVLGDLVRATKDPDESLSRDEVVSILVQLLTAGNETTTSLIGSALMLMLRDTELQDRLRAHPKLVEPFIEEALRLESPFYGHFRVVRRDAEVAGVPLPAGSRVMLLWASANRDDREFENPDQIDLGRRNLRGHLSFGIGIHHCIGAPLARLETRVALETLLARTRTLRLAAENDFAHVPSLFVRSLKALHIEFQAA
jgi:cytochrome P450